MPVESLILLEGPISHDTLTRNLELWNHPPTPHPHTPPSCITKFRHRVNTYLNDDLFYEIITPVNLSQWSSKLNHFSLLNMDDSTIIQYTSGTLWVPNNLVFSSSHSLTTCLSWLQYLSRCQQTMQVSLKCAVCQAICGFLCDCVNSILGSVVIF